MIGDDLLNPVIIKPTNFRRVSFGMLPSQLTADETNMIRHLRARPYTAAGLASACHCEWGTVVGFLRKLESEGLVHKAGEKINRSKHMKNETLWRIE